jgi:hypothetical protein
MHLHAILFRQSRWNSIVREWLLEKVGADWPATGHLQYVDKLEKGRWCILTAPIYRDKGTKEGYYTFLFKEEKDAVLFKLTWG